MEPTADQAVVLEPDPDVERGLKASVKVFQFAKDRLEATNDDSVITITKADLIMLRKAGVVMNNSITRIVKKHNAAEDRLILEHHLMRQAMTSEGTDRDANRARVYEFLRRFHPGDEDGTTAPMATSATSSQHSNPLLAPSQAHQSVDRALATVARIEQSLATLNPTGTTRVHGAGLIAAHNEFLA
jgi:hypothetical protein